MPSGHQIDELFVTLGFRLSPQFRQTIQRIDRGMQNVDAAFQQVVEPITRVNRNLAAMSAEANRSLGLAGRRADDFADDVGDMAQETQTDLRRAQDAFGDLSQEARRDLRRTGRAMDDVGQDAREMATDIDRASEQSERSLDDLGAKARQTGRRVAGAFAGIGAAAAVKDTAAFRQELARIDSQLPGLTFEQVEQSVLGIARELGSVPEIVAQLASQIDNNLAPTAEAFYTQLRRSVSLQKAVGLEDIQHVQQLVNAVNDLAPPEERDLLTDQLTLFLQRAPLAREQLDGLNTVLRAAYTAGIAPRDYLAGLLAQPFSSPEVAGAVVEDLGRELNEVVKAGGVVDFNALLFGTGELPDELGEQTRLWVNSTRDAADAQSRFVQAQGGYDRAAGTTARALENQRKATGGLLDMMVKLNVLLKQSAGGALEVAGGLAVILPAAGGAALLMQTLGFDLTGVAGAVRRLKGVLNLLSVSWWRNVAAKLAAAGASRAETFAIRAMIIQDKIAIAFRWLHAAAANALSLSFWRNTAAQTASRIAMIAGTVATVAATAATTAFGVAMTVATGPIGLIILAVAGLIVGIVLLVKNFDWVKAKAEAVWDFILGAIQGVWNWIRDNWPLLLAIITGPIGLAVYAFVKFKDDIIGVFASVKDFIVGVWQSIWDFILGIINRIKNAPAELLESLPGGKFLQKAVVALPGFAAGGVVPGPVGRAQAAIVHGGEMVLPQPFAENMQRLLDGGVSALVGPAPGMAMAGGGGTVIHEDNRTFDFSIAEGAVVVHAAPGQDAAEIGEVVSQKLRAEIRAAYRAFDSGIHR